MTYLSKINQTRSHFSSSIALTYSVDDPHFTSHGSTRMGIRMLDKPAGKKKYPPIFPPRFVKWDDKSPIRGPRGVPGGSQGGPRRSDNFTPFRLSILWSES